MKNPRTNGKGLFVGMAKHESSHLVAQLFNALSVTVFYSSNVGGVLSAELSFVFVIGFLSRFVPLILQVISWLALKVAIFNFKTLN